MSAPPRLTGLAILLVEDNYDSRDILEVFLTHAGASVRSAASAGEALELFKTVPAAIVITDIVPQRDGVWLLRQIRSIAGVSRVPVVALTGRVLPHEREMLRAAGFDGLIVKPPDDDVVEVIAAFTGR